MGTCETKRIKATLLCIGDLNHLCEIQERELQESDFESSQPVEVFTTLRYQWFAIETVGAGVARFAKINVLEAATHIFWTVYDADFPVIEERNTWILSGAKRYKILKSHNINELNTTVAIQTVERGPDTLEASQA